MRVLSQDRTGLINAGRGSDGESAAPPAQPPVLSRLPPARHRKRQAVSRALASAGARPAASAVIRQMARTSTISGM